MHNNLSSITRSENVSINTKQNAFKPGQILNGKVLEIYPNQRAAIQLGGSQVVAQLETALSAKQNYLFQVTSVGDVIQLKKISELHIESNKPLSDQLMQQIGLGNNRQLKAFIQQLVNQHIPFTYTDAQAAVNLMEQFGANPNNRELLITMIKYHLPLTEQVFRSLQAFQSTQLGTQMNQLYQQLMQLGERNPSLLHLQQQLSIFGSFGSSQVQSMLQQFIHTHQPELQQLLTNLFQDQPTLIKQLTSGQSLTKNQLEAITEHLNQILKQQLSLSQGERQAISSFLQRLGQMIDQGTVTNTLKNAVHHQAFFQQSMHVLSQQDQLIVRQWLQSSDLNVAQDREVYSIFQQLNSQQLSQPEQKVARTLLLHLNTVYPSSLSVRDQFLHMMKHFLQTSGIQDEALLAQSIRSTGTTTTVGNLLHTMMTSMSQQDRQVIQQWLAQVQPTASQSTQVTEIIQRINLQQIPQPAQTLVRQVVLSLEHSEKVLNKDQLLQMFRQVINQAERANIQVRDMDYSLKQNLLAVNSQNYEASNQIQRLLYSITGMQLNMVQDGQAITQQSFQIPGERFGLASDIRMEFEGKKRSNSEEIDPEYCRVLFHLHLNTIGETMITMSIQKRIVHISVYNDQQGIKALMDNFKPLLKDQLSKLDYHLSTVTHKALSNNEQHGAINHNHATYKTMKREGIDFRI